MRLVAMLLLLTCGCGRPIGPPRGEPRVLDRAALAPAMRAAAPDLHRAVLQRALRAAERAWADGWGTPEPRMAVIDFRRSSARPRLHVFDLETGQRLFHERVSHGAGRPGHRSGYSNESGSHLSSVGVYVGGEAYSGRHGTSLRLHGLERGFNDHALQRAIVLHGADYATASFARAHGRLGRSHGCPAVRPEIAPALVAALEGGALLMIDGADARWLRRSAFVGR